MRIFIQRFLRTILLIYLTFLLQTTVVRFFSIQSIQPDLLAVMVILLCQDGDVYFGFCAGAFAGLLMDATIGQVAIVHLLFYTLVGAAAAGAYTVIWKKLDDIPLPFLIAPLVALVVMALKEILMIGYVYLSGVEIMLTHFLRALICVIYSAVLGLLLQWPVRQMMTIRDKKKKEPNP